MIENVENNVTKFESTVRKYFEFLIRMGYEQNDAEVEDIETPHDYKIQIKYISQKVCVIIEWFVAYSDIGIGFVKLDNGKLPLPISYYSDSDSCIAIGLYDLVSYFTNGKKAVPLPTTLLTDTNSKTLKKWKIRNNLLEKSFENILKELADLCHEYAIDILNGDFSIFQEVQKYSKSKIENKL